MKPKAERKHCFQCLKNIQFVKNHSIGTHLNHSTSSKLILYSLQVITVTLVLFCILIVEDIVQDIIVQIKGAWRFLNSIHLYINKTRPSERKANRDTSSAVEFTKVS